MRYPFIYCFGLVFLLVSCNQIYKEYEKDSFATLSWKRGQQIIFYPEIDDLSKTYELTLGLRHVYGAQIKRMDISVTIVSPSGKEKIRQFSFDVMDDKGEFLASCAGNMCDLEAVVDDELSFSETGKYKFILTHNMDQERVRGVMEFGLIIGEK
jgi:gliding motility-associated lipoprotein GldH